MRPETAPRRRYGTGAEMAMASIEEELSHQWEEAQEGGRAVVHRIRVLTLVTYGPMDPEAEYVPELLGRLAARHPCRVIAISHDPGASESEVVAQASTHCILSPGRAETPGRQVCCEEIRLRALGDVRRDIRAAVAALTIPHLPVFLWWRSDISGRESILDELADLSDRVILDSRRFSSLAAGIARLKILSARGRSVVSDLEWARLLPWRTLLARTFDTPEARPYLRRISGVSVEVDGETATGQGVLQGLYLIAWLSGRLGWASEAAHWLNDDELAVDFRRGPETVRVAVKGQSIRRPARAGAGGPEDEKAGLTAVEISASGAPSPGAAPGREPGGGGLRLTARRTAQRECVSLNMEMAGRPVEPRAVRLSPRTLADLLTDELDAAGRDPVYEAALAGVARILASIGRGDI